MCKLSSLISLFYNSEVLFTEMDLHVHKTNKIRSFPKWTILTNLWQHTLTLTILRHCRLKWEQVIFTFWCLFSCTWEECLLCYFLIFGYVWPWTSITTLETSSRHFTTLKILKECINKHWKCRDCEQLLHTCVLQLW